MLKFKDKKGKVSMIVRDSDTAPVDINKIQDEKTIEKDKKDEKNGK